MRVDIYNAKIKQKISDREFSGIAPDPETLVECTWDLIL